MQFGILGRDDSESMFPPIESFDRRIIDSPSALNIQLTPGEIQVAALVREGLTTKEIAGTLNISAHAVDFHRKNIRSKSRQRLFQKEKYHDHGCYTRCSTFFVT